MLQRNAPLPPGLARGRTRIRRGRGDPLAGHRERAVAGQPVAPVLVTRVQRLLDEQPAKTRAVDEQVAGDFAAIGELHGIDEAVFTVLLHVYDLAFDTLDAIRFAEAAQEGGV